MDLPAASLAFQALPLGAQIAAGAAALLLGLIVLRVLQNKFPGRAPPVEEGIPFIGGLIKFSKVRGAPWPPPPPLPSVAPQPLPPLAGCGLRAASHPAVAWCRLPAARARCR